MNPWIGVDLDGTLAVYTEWVGPLDIGAPIPLMVTRVRSWLMEGRDVRIFTARVAPPILEDGVSMDDVYYAIEDWCMRHIGQVLPITYKKDYGMVELWDDRAVQVEPNTGLRVDGKRG